jgi:hypothetical protein
MYILVVPQQRLGNENIESSWSLEVAEWMAQDPFCCHTPTMYSGLTVPLPLPQKFGFVFQSAWNKDPALFGEWQVQAWQDSVSLSCL